MRKVLMMILLLTMSACSIPGDIELTKTHRSDSLELMYNDTINITELDATNSFTSLNIKETSDFLIISDIIAISSLDQTMQEQENNILLRINASADTYFEDIKLGEYSARSLSYRDPQTNAHSRIIFVLLEDDYHFIRYSASNSQGRSLFDAIIETIRFTK